MSGDERQHLTLSLPPNFNAAIRRVNPYLSEGTIVIGL
jgi:hypothetical protein